MGSKLLQAEFTGIQATMPCCNAVWTVLSMIVVFLLRMNSSEGQYAVEYGCTSSWDTTQVCWDSSCIRTALDLLNSVDPSVDPCVDFYSYACSGWVKKNPLPKNHGSWDEWTKLELEVTDFVKKSLKSKEVRARYSKVKAIVKAFNFYEACMSVKESENGRHLLTELTKKFVAWPPLDPKWNESDFDLVETLAAVNRELNSDPFFSTIVESDLKNSSRNMITFKQAFIGGLFHGQLTRDTPYAIKAKDSYKAAIANLSELVGLSNATERRQLAEEILQLEVAAGKISRSFNDFDDKALYGKYKISELTDRTGQTPVDWLRYINLAYKGIGHSFTADEEIIVYDMPYFINMTNLMRNLSKKTLMTYMGWIIIWRNYENLGQKFLEIHEAFKKQAFGFGTTTRETLCFYKFTQEFAMPISRIFVDKRFSGDSKKLAEDLSLIIKDVFIENLKRNDWMSKKSTLAAIEKAKHMIENIGYPDYILNDEKLDKEFENVEVDKSSFFKTMLSMYANFKRNEYLLALKPVDKNIWSQSPLLVNAAYEPTENKMIFPSAYLQPPFYDQKYSRAVSFGGIGTIMAHELIHGFDNEGKEFDKYGNNIKWWSDKTIPAFAKRAQCLVEQYSNITFMGEKVNGVKTLSENIGDNGGLRQAYQAYQKWRKINGEEKRLPGLMLSNDQVFFISFARNWCITYKSALYAFDRFSITPHAPKPVRVNATLQNSEPFSKAFNCPLGSPMNPKKKCPTW